MICSKCGTQNVEESKFCIGCGNNLELYKQQTQYTSMQNQNSAYQQPIQQNVNMMNNVEPISQQTQYNDYQQQNISTSNSNISVSMSISECFFVVLAVILKPFTTFKEELNKLDDFKNSIILSLFISIIATLITLVKTMFSIVRVTSYWSKEVKWDWENLKEINYVQVIGKNFLIYLGIIVAIACVYYIGSLIVKKQTNFSRLLGISAISVVPMLICSSILSPLLTMVSAQLGMGITIIGGVYTVIILYETINSEILLEGNIKIYFNLVCLSILAIAVYYLYMKVFMGSVSNSVSNILDMFGY